MADADLTIVILRQLQSDMSELKVDVRDLGTRMSSLEEKYDVTNERLSMVERASTFMAAQVNVMPSHGHRGPTNRRRHP